MLRLEARKPKLAAPPGYNQISRTRPLVPGAHYDDQIRICHRRSGVFLGKGIAAASLAAILESRGLQVTMLKLDPYINVDPGTMSPFQHGEVFVTEDGAETDLTWGTTSASFPPACTR